MSTQPNTEPNVENRRMDRWFRFLYAVIWPFFNLMRPLRVHGKEHIPEGAAVICEGGGDPRVQSGIYALLYALYGLSSTRVSVEQMKP